MKINVTFSETSQELKVGFSDVKTIHGEDGKSAYEIALANGFKGSEKEWLESLKGEPGVPPIVGENGNWHTWDGETYIDTGYSATALHNENGGGLVKMWFGTIAEYNALDTIYNDVLYHIIEGAIPV